MREKEIKSGLKKEVYPMENNNKLQTLLEAQHKKEFLIADITGGIDMKSRLENMGIRVGKKIKKLSSVTSKGPHIIEITGSSSHIALGQEMAKKILVSHENKK
jgi:Fe2+ transport system protein FeoA